MNFNLILIYWYVNNDNRECSSRMNNLTFPGNHLDKWVRQIWCTLRKQYFSFNFVTMRSAWLKRCAFCESFSFKITSKLNYVTITHLKKRYLKLGNKRILKIYWQVTLLLENCKRITKFFILQSILNRFYLKFKLRI